MQSLDSHFYFSAQAVVVFVVVVVVVVVVVSMSVVSIQRFTLCTHGDSLSLPSLLAKRHAQVSRGAANFCYECTYRADAVTPPFRARDIISPGYALMNPSIDEKVRCGVYVATQKGKTPTMIFL